MIDESGGRGRRVLILVEEEGGRIAPISFELLRAGRELADKLGGMLCTAVLGNEVGNIANECIYFSDECYCIDQILLANSQVDLRVHSLEKLIRNVNPEIILIGQTLDNLDLAPRLAWRMGTGLITDCIGFDVDGESAVLLCTKPVYGDNATAIFILENKPYIATLRSKVMDAIGRSSKKGKVINFDPMLNPSLAKTELIKTVTGESVSLDKADAVVAGGRGLRIQEKEEADSEELDKQKGLKMIGDLVEVLRKFFGKVELGGSRPLIDAGWLPSSRQVGLTGERVSPQLYVAVGISGASQHLSGMLGSKKIVAINKDERAAIFKSADYGVVGGYEDVLPAIVKKLRELT
jgi:electron transfer flavoprotein alpha subunit